MGSTRGGDNYVFESTLSWISLTSRALEKSDGLAERQEHLFLCCGSSVCFPRFPDRGGACGIALG